MKEIMAEETKTQVNKTELREFVNFMMECWNNQPFLDEETEEKLEQDIKTLLIPASEEGNPDAIHCMAKLYDSGKWSVQLDEEKALAYARLLAEKGRPDWQVIMGFYYSQGKVVRGGAKDAFKWFMKAAEQGDAWGQFLVAECYANGTGVRKSYKKALEWYTKVAEKGDKDAMLWVGWYYCNGLGVERDDQKGYEWIEKSGYKSVLELLKKTEDDRDGFVDYFDLPKGDDPDETW